MLGKSQHQEGKKDTVYAEWSEKVTVTSTKTAPARANEGHVDAPRAVAGGTVGPANNLGCGGGLWTAARSLFLFLF